MLNHHSVSFLTLFWGFPSNPSIPKTDYLCCSNLTGSDLNPSFPVWLAKPVWRAFLSANNGFVYSLSSSLSEFPAYNPPALSYSLWSNIRSWFVGWACPKAIF